MAAGPFEAGGGVVEGADGEFTFLVGPAAGADGVQVFEAVAVVGFEEEGGGVGVGAALGRPETDLHWVDGVLVKVDGAVLEESFVNRVGGGGVYGHCGVLVDLGHGLELDCQVVVVVLDDAETVNPEMGDCNVLADCNGVLDGGWKFG